MGAMLIYYFRSLERRAGSSKFACFVTFTTGLSLALQGMQVHEKDVTQDAGMLASLWTWACICKLYRTWDSG